MRVLSVALVCGLLLVQAGMAVAAQAKVTSPPLKVFRTATCGCCQKWVNHMEAAGFTPAVEVLASLDAVKDESKVPAALRSCHTAIVGGYVIEGHVPADVVQRLLREKPMVAGLAVPGMPIGSPGMEQGDRKDSYDIIAFTKDGKTSVYERR